MKTDESDSEIRRAYEMFIKKIEETDGAIFGGRKAVTLYSVGCNFRCGYCGFGDLVSGKKTDECLELEDLKAYLESREGELEGVVFSGGEPTVHDDLEDWIDMARSLNLAVMLETNGTKPEVIRRLLEGGKLDYIAMDVKAPIQNYASIAGVRMNMEVIRTSVWTIKHSGVDHEFRTTVVPGYHTVREIKSIAELVHGAQKYVVQDFISTSPLRRELSDRPAFAKKVLEDLRRYCERRVQQYEIRHFPEAKRMPSLRKRMRQPVLSC